MWLVDWPFRIDASLDLWLIVVEDGLLVWMAIYYIFKFLKFLLVKKRDSEREKEDSQNDKKKIEEKMIKFENKMREFQF